jgi:hypothetical protein
VPLNFTELAPVKLEPVITTWLPTGPLTGEKLLITGDPETVTVKTLVLTADPVLVFVTVIEPEVAPFGTVAVI